LGFLFIKEIASSIFWYDIIGRMGPKISVYIKGESGEGSRITVGVRLESVCALGFPMITFP